MVEISILASTEALVTAIVASMVEISILASTEALAAAIVASMVKISILASAEALVTAIVAVVVLVGIHTIADRGMATVVTYVVLVLVNMNERITVCFTALGAGRRCVTRSVTVRVRGYVRLAANIASVVAVTLGIRAALKLNAAAPVANVVVVVCSIGVSANAFASAIFVADVVAVLVNVSERRTLRYVTFFAMLCHGAGSVYPGVLVVSAKHSVASCTKDWHLTVAACCGHVSERLTLGSFTYTAGPWRGTGRIVKDVRTFVIQVASKVA